MRLLPSSSLGLAIALAALLPVACGGGSSTDNVAGSTSSGSTSSVGAGGSGGGSTGIGGDTIEQPELKFTISPTTATIDVIDGVAAPVQFQGLNNGSAVGASWQVDLSSIAGVDPSGQVTATGQQGGTVTLTGTYAGQTATATINVKLHKTLGDGAVADADKTLLDAASDADGAVVWAYPYDKTVFPKGLLAPELMWNGGGADDSYFIHFSGQFIDFKVYTKAAAPSRFTLDEESWKQLTESGQGGSVQIHVARLQPGAPAAAVVIDHSWTIANGSLRGTVYYWANSLGKVVRIKPGAAAPDDFLGAQDGCTTCHTVSANGSTLINGGDASLTTWDLLTNTKVYDQGSFGARRLWSNPALSPDGKVLIVNNDSRVPGPAGAAGAANTDGMWTPQTGARIADTGLEGTWLRMPSFSPDGTKIAFVDQATLTLGVYDFDAVNTKASNPVTLISDPGSNASTDAIAFPYMSPDAKWVAYHRGPIDSRNGPADLYLASVDEPGVEYPLDNLNGATYPFAAGARDLHGNYEPTFAPVNSGGYAWVVFTSRRTYGNRLTGTAAATKQLWVAAIDQNPVPGQEPSHPAFHVPGQDASMNIRGFWALDPCKQVGGACGTGSECCNQNCEAGVCTEPDVNECSQDGNHCDEASDCCVANSQCINHICSARIQ